MINDLNLFINQPVRTGRQGERHQDWIGGGLPNLTVDGVYRSYHSHRRCSWRCAAVLF